MTPPKLKPCPFCGRNPGIEYWQDEIRVYCTCLGFLETKWMPRREAVRLWNKRKEPSR